MKNKNIILAFTFSLFSIGCSAGLNQEYNLVKSINLKNNGDVRVILVHGVKDDRMIATNLTWIQQKSTFEIPLGSLIQIKNKSGEILKDPSGKDWWDVSIFSSQLDIAGNGKSEDEFLTDELWKSGTEKEITFNVHAALRMILSEAKERNKLDVDDVIYRIKFVMSATRSEGSPIDRSALTSEWSSR